MGIFSNLFKKKEDEQKTGGMEDYMTLSLIHI